LTSSETSYTTTYALSRNSRVAGLVLLIVINKTLANFLLLLLIMALVALVFSSAGKARFHDLTDFGVSFDLPQLFVLLSARCDGGCACIRLGWISVLCHSL